MGPRDDGGSRRHRRRAQRPAPAELSEDDGGAIGMLFFFFGVPLLVIIIALVFAGRCPRCHKRTLKRVGTEVISRTRNEVVEETPTSAATAVMW